MNTSQKIVLICEKILLICIAVAPIALILVSINLEGEFILWVNLLNLLFFWILPSFIILGLFRKIFGKTIEKAKLLKYVDELTEEFSEEFTEALRDNEKN